MAPLYLRDVVPCSDRVSLDGTCGPLCGGRSGVAECEGGTGESNNIYVGQLKPPLSAKHTDELAQSMAIL